MLKVEKKVLGTLTAMEKMENGQYVVLTLTMEQWSDKSVSTLMRFARENGYKGGRENIGGGVYIILEKASTTADTLNTL